MIEEIMVPIHPGGVLLEVWQKSLRSLKNKPKHPYRKAAISLLLLLGFTGQSQAQTPYHETCDDKSDCYIYAMAVGPGDHFWFIRGHYLLEFANGNWWKYDLPYQMGQYQKKQQNRYLYSGIVLDRNHRPLIGVFDRSVPEAKATLYRLKPNGQFELVFTPEDIQQQYNMICFPQVTSQTFELQHPPAESSSFPAPGAPCPVPVQAREDKDKTDEYYQREYKENWIQTDRWNQIYLAPFWKYKMLIDSEDQIWRGRSQNHSSSMAYNGLVLNRFDIRTGQVRFYPEVGAVEPQFEDKQGNIWFIEDMPDRMQRYHKRDKLGNWTSFAPVDYAAFYQELGDDLPVEAFSDHPQLGVRDQAGYVYRIRRHRVLEVFYENKWQVVYYGGTLGNGYDSVKNMVIDHQNVLWINTLTQIIRLLPAQNPTQRQVESVRKLEQNTYADQTLAAQSSVTGMMHMYVDQHNVKWFFRLPASTELFAPGLLKYIDGQGFIYHRFE